MLRWFGALLFQIALAKPRPSTHGRQPAARDELPSPNHRARTSPSSQDGSAGASVHPLRAEREAPVQDLVHHSADQLCLMANRQLMPRVRRQQWFLIGRAGQWPGSILASHTKRHCPHVRVLRIQNQDAERNSLWRRPLGACLEAAGNHFSRQDPLNIEQDAMFASKRLNFLVSEVQNLAVSHGEHDNVVGTSGGDFA